MRTRAIVTLLALFPLGCGSSDPEAGSKSPAGTGGDAGSGGASGAAGAESGGGPSSGGAGLGGGAGAPASGCEGAASRCTGWNARASCVSGAWSEETCAAGCFAGACDAAQCADECTLGQKGSLGTCRLWDLKSSAWLEPDAKGSTHDRARSYAAWLPEHHLPHGMVVNARFADAALGKLTAYDGLVDSALWTGTWLAAESWRYLATGAPDAAARVADGVAVLHRAFGVTGIPGYLARYVLPVGSTEPIPWTCGMKHHCNAEWQGKLYHWRGDTSRDQYTGVMLGLMLAYRASPDAAVKATIREDVVRLALELTKVRKQVPVHIELDGVPLDATLDIENVILVPNETADGKIRIVIDSSDFASAQMDGVREFIPDWSVPLHQIPLLSWLPPIPRGSAAMLGAYLAMALEMSAGVPGFEAEHAALAAYHQSKSKYWAGVAAGWSYGNACGGKYYGTHIEYISAYTWAMTEPPGEVGTLVRDAVLDDAMWDSLSQHKNVYYAFLWGGTRASPDAQAIGAARAQLGLFPPGPRVHAARNSLNEYPHDSACSSDGVPHSKVALDVDDRVVSEFMWQRHPWKLTDAGDPTEVFPGIDYLAAYWAGRHHGLVEDDRSGTCARWAK